MADKKISALTSATTPLAGTEVLPIVQSNETVKVSIDNLTTGKVTPTNGVKFPAVQVASADANTLDDYEEGTWTPVIGGETSQTGQSYVVQRGTYTKVGQMVTCNFDVVLANKGTITGDVSLKGLPFISAASSNFAYPAVSIGLWQNFVTTYVYVNGIVVNNATYATLKAATTAATSLSAILTADVANNTRISGTLVYFAA
jgi:hypothetical protein